MLKDRKLNSNTRFISSETILPAAEELREMTNSMFAEYKLKLVVKKVNDLERIEIVGG